MTENIDNTKIKRDFYEAVNGDWINNTSIPSDHSSTGGFIDLADNIEETLMSDFSDLLSGKIIPKNPEMTEFKKFYKLSLDFNKREKDGSHPIKPILQRIENLQTYEDLSNQLTDWILNSFPTPFSLTINSDMKNSKIYALFASAPQLFLPDKTYYRDDKPTTTKLMQIFTNMSEQLLQLANYTTDDAKKIVDNAKQFDRLIAPHVKSAEESADYSKLYNPRSLEEISASTDKLDLKRAIITLVGTTPTKIITQEPDYFNALHTILTLDNFILMKNWMIVKTVNSLSGYLTENFRVTGGIFNRILSGQKQPRNQEKSAYYLAINTFDQVVGDYYGRKYFGSTAKRNVHNMIIKIINVYKKRLTNNIWLSQKTRDKAILKLNKLGIQVGYPNDIDPIFSKFKVIPAENGGTLLSNVLAFDRITTEDAFNKWNKQVDRSKWEMGAHTVNAYFHPFHNTIVFPAAILQAPFYSIDQSSSQNLGGIGAVIAHEISHAFDNNGALFDEYGSLNNWWTDDDNKKFQLLAIDMIKEFNGIEFANEHVNGKLTVSENIADAGGLSCALEVAKSENEANIRDFFVNWATIWRQKSTTERDQLLLSIDVHAPAKLRANIQVQNLDDFFKTFNIHSGDGMFRNESDRVKIW